MNKNHCFIEINNVDVTNETEDRWKHFTEGQQYFHGIARPATEGALDVKPTRLQAPELREASYRPFWQSQQRHWP